MFLQATIPANTVLASSLCFCSAGCMQTRPQSACGSCLEIQCTGAHCTKNITTLPMVITDSCNWDCNATNINMHVFAFEQLAPLKYGRTSIKYRCAEDQDTTAPLVPRCLASYYEQHKHHACMLSHTLPFVLDCRTAAKLITQRMNCRVCMWCVMLAVYARGQTHICLTIPPAPAAATLQAGDLHSCRPHHRAHPGLPFNSGRLAPAGLQECGRGCCSHISGAGGCRQRFQGRGRCLQDTHSMLLRVVRCCCATPNTLLMPDAHVLDDNDLPTCDNKEMPAMPCKACQVQYAS
jgi:hypothetical protein